MGRTASCRAKGRVITLMLTKQTFDEFLAQYPDIANGIAQIAEERFHAYLATQKVSSFGQELKISITSNDLKNVCFLFEVEVDCVGSYF